MSAQNDSAFLRMFMLILGALVLFTIIILFLANLITGSVEEARGPDPRLQALVAERIKPVGSVNIAAPAPAAAASAGGAATQSGADVAAAACNGCHAAGVLGAPKTGDKAAWETRLNAAGGVDGLTASVLNGKGSMPPRGGSAASDDAIRAAVVHLLGESGVDADAAPAAAAAAPAP
ncbi:MAG: c-type cytochrome, partial [Gammaproteobacteria bacterium]|nr:c-type cytochrome [Gammaproteobacteria bacterium]